MSDPQQCNVYLWLDNNVPFYVGIGGNKRLRNKRRNKWATNRRKQAEERGSFRQEVILVGSRPACCSTEELLISTYGSVVNGGLLFNFTPGGDGGIDKKLLPIESMDRIILGGINGSRKAKEMGVGFWSPEITEIRKQNGIRNGNLAVNSGQLEKARSCINYDSMGPEMRERGRLMGEANKGKVSITNGKVTKMISEGETIPEGWRKGDSGGKRAGAIRASYTLWEDPDHPEIGQHNAGNLVRRQKSCGLPYSKANRRKVDVNSQLPRSLQN